MRCPLLRSCLSIEVNRRTVRTFGIDAISWVCASCCGVCPLSGVPLSDHKQWYEFHAKVGMISLITIYVRLESLATSIGDSGKPQLIYCA